MRLNKILVLLISIILVTGCTSISRMNLDDVVNSLSRVGNNPNTFRRGFKYYTPKGLHLKDAGTNYVILSSSTSDYYLYFDLIDYNENKKIEYKINGNAYYSKMIDYKDKLGYVEINKQKNNQYLIEIMYNYAKIEVMVDDEHLKSALANTINILKSVEYDKKIIESMLNENNLAQKEEVFDLFREVKRNSDTLEYVEGSTDTSNNEEIQDTDFIN